MNSSGGNVWAVVVTYARPLVLEGMLDSLARQSRRPDQVIVVDNDSDPEVHQIATKHQATYLDSGDNIGPAGGITVGMRHVLPLAQDDDWILLVDDDDEPRDADQLRQLWDFGEELVRRDPRVAGVSAGGSVYRPSLGIFRRLDDSELVGTVELDTLFGGSLPMYRIRAVRDVGTFDTNLFWGFEEAEYGLRLRRRGYRLCAPGETFLRARQLAGTAGLDARTIRTPVDKAAWRRYYSVRNSTVVARRYGGPLAPLVTAFGGATKGVVAGVRSGRHAREVLLAPRGAWHGLTNRLGRRIDPGRNHKS